MGDNNEMFHARMPKELADWIRKKAKQFNTNPSAFLRRMLEFLKEMDEGLAK